MNSFLQKAKYFFELGLHFFEQKDFNSAEEKFNQALLLAPDRPSILINLSATLIELGKWDECERICRKILANDKSSYDGLLNLGVCMSRKEQGLEALAYLDKAIKINPHSGQAWVNKGNILQELGHLNDAAKCLNQALQLNPGNEEALIGMGNVHNELKEYQAALQDFDAALEINPSNPQARWNKSLSLLRLGEFKEGWKLFEARWQISGMREHQRHFNAPIWLGRESLKYRTILIYAEQGYGDTIQFCRYIPLIESMGAKVLFLAPIPLTKLMRTLSPTVHIIEDKSPESEVLSKKIDFQCPIMSLALAFKTSLETIPLNVPYLSADQYKFKLWLNFLEKLSQKNEGGMKPLRVGIAWNGSGHYAGMKNPKRDIPKEQIAMLIDCFQGKAIEFHSLQIEGYKNQEVINLIKGQFFTHDQYIKDFSDTAALLSHMDLVVSVDTAIAHLAGAMNLPTLLLLPDPPDFMSLTKHDLSPWYPSVSLLRQRERGKWDAPLDAAKEKIAQKYIYAI